MTKSATVTRFPTKTPPSKAPRKSFNLRKWYVEQLNDPEFPEELKVKLAIKLADFEWARPAPEAKLGKKEIQKQIAEQTAATGSLADLVS